MRNVYVYEGSLPLPLGVYITGIFPRLYKKSHSRVFCKNSSNPHQNAGLKNITHREIFEFVFVKNIDMLQAFQPLNEFP